MPVFQSARAVRRATAERSDRVLVAVVSIRARRAARDMMPGVGDGEGWGFNPRAPCGARLEESHTVRLENHVSIRARRAARDVAGR